MADLNDIEDIAGGIAGYNFYQRMVNKHGQINVLFYGALILVTTIGLFIAGFHAIMNWDSNHTWNKVKIDDKMYADESYFGKNNKENYSFDVYQLAVPITTSGIDSMNLPKWKKNSLKGKLDTSLKPQLISHALLIYPDSMYKYNTSFIGTFISKDSVLEDAFSQKWYRIKPNFKITNSNHRDSIPSGYKILKNFYYVDATLVQLNEATPFSKQLSKHK